MIERDSIKLHPVNPVDPVKKQPSHSSIKIYGEPQ